MLVFTRKAGETIVINGDIAVTIVRVGPNDVRIGIEAPAETPIVRNDAAPQANGGKREGAGRGRQPPRSMRCRSLS
ncbi:MAG TPA: carbon storage regulator [Pirellulales bacterium]|nr:carbon storage regulator [Pirellulales bacterium]